MTSAEAALFASAITGAAVITGALWTQRYQAKKAEAAARSRAIQETEAAADDLLVGVGLFRQARKHAVWARLLGIIVKVFEGKEERLFGDSLDTLPEGQALWAIFSPVVGAVAPGGLLEQLRDKDLTYFQAMVMPAQQRLTAAVSSLRVGPDRRLADAAEALVTAGIGMADAAVRDSWRVFRRAQRSFQRRLGEFRRAAEG